MIGISTVGSLARSQEKNFWCSMEWNSTNCDNFFVHFQWIWCYHRHSDCFVFVSLDINIVPYFHRDFGNRCNSQLHKILLLFFVDSDFKFAFRCLLLGILFCCITLVVGCFSYDTNNMYNWTMPYGIFRGKHVRFINKNIDTMVSNTRQDS